MKIVLWPALAAAALLISMPAFADKSLKSAPGWKAEPTSRCEWIGGGIDPILSCTSEVETDNEIIVHNCVSSSIQSKCQKFSKKKEKQIEPSVTHVPMRDGGSIKVMRGGSALR